jgi:hypothetical protein
MAGLEDRLRNLAGVSGISVELADDGSLQWIRVRPEPGAEEAEILEDIRRILFAYNFSSDEAGESRGDTELTSVDVEDAGGEAHYQVSPKGSASESKRTTEQSVSRSKPSGDREGSPIRREIKAGPGVWGLQVTLSDGGDVITSSHPRSPEGAALAMLDVVARSEGWKEVDSAVTSIARLGDRRVLVVVGSRGDLYAAGAADLGEGWARALYKAARAAIIALQ